MASVHSQERTNSSGQATAEHRRLADTHSATRAERDCAAKQKQSHAHAAKGSRQDRNNGNRSFFSDTFSEGAGPAGKIGKADTKPEANFKKGWSSIELSHCMPEVDAVESGLSQKKTKETKICV